MMPERLLLDTCAILWLATGDERLSRQAKAAIAKAGIVFVSPISAWEIARKHKKGNLKLPIPPRELFAEIVERYALDIIPLDLPMMFKASELEEHHKDPADRFIIAAALLNGLTVVTGDHRFPEYGIPTIC